MSLLMDALKRAEKARQAEASSDGAESDLASTQGFSLDPIEESAAAEPRAPREPTLDQPVSQSDLGSDEAGELSLEDTSALRGRLGVEDDDLGSASLEDSGGRSLDDSISLIDDEDAVDVPHRLPDDTSATLPSMKQARDSVDDYFEGTRSSTVTRDDLSEAIANEETAPRERGAGDTDTQRRVRAVFHAKEASRGRRGRNWVLVGLVPLLLLAIVGGVVFVYLDSLSGLIFGKPPLVQAPRTTPRPVEPAPQPVTDPAPRPSSVEVAPPAVAGAAQTLTLTATTGAGTTAPPSSGASAPATSAPSAAGAQDAASTGGAGRATTASAQSTAQTMTELAASAPTAAQVTTATNEDSSRRLSAEEQVARAIQRAGLAPASPTGGTAFKIKRTSTPDKLHPRLVRAYDAWRSGNLAAARRDYERVLKSDPRNRNALLGLGAVAVRDGQWDEASDRYTALLRLNPKDSIAQAGLIAVHENVDPLRGESQIKLLLREEPDAPHLHFTLGNMYAAQRRWGEAQSAYFNAYRLQSENPDYVYNLAVSLDQLGKSAAAADYYRRALELAAVDGAAFDPPSVRDRLLRLAFEGAAQ